MIDLLKRADAFIQRHFDASVHWVMLTFGVTKGFVRYAFGSCGVLALLGAALSVGRWWWAYTVLALTMAFLAENSRRHDAAADARGMWAPGDAEQRVLPYSKVVHAARMPLFATWYVTFDAKALNAFLFIHSFCGLAQAYLFNTNPRPPKKRQRVLVTQTEDA